MANLDIRQQTENPVIMHDLPPHVRARVKVLLFDLVNDDLPMALLDLERLYRAVRSAPEVADSVGALASPETVEALIYYNDGETKVQEVCAGPDEQGRCPRAEQRRPVTCAGKRLTAKGWDIGVAADAEACPLVALGIVKRPPVDRDANHVTGDSGQ